ncbi:hamartin [Uranotaenia lowii]|uniref:hamartin n=1 Tax=Uranotaenia lowii TaxID=190385 RepID=UPI00247AD55A|nr:hamartin [Uranotaenia lowii]XP_055612809.1 hamartin [Uranotaenia lowii]XP_055612810.1 hamartin [Uranotaenia lowii]
MDVGKLFSDLESNNLTLVDESKKRFSELFGATRETWISHCMMDYFGQTSSIRIVDILVKVQHPHDKYILDKLADWIRSGSNKMLALTLFGHIIQKRPTWLYKVGSHQLVKEVLKLSRLEREIIPLINAVLCIIDLLPVIPLVMGGYVQDLFEVFNYLATFDRNTSVSLPEDQLIHLQFGLYELFNRLYGMYPCNFVTFLKQQYRGDKQAVFQHTIKPLLDTVKIHPRLVFSDKDSEISQVRWKNMEPHDVVNECARMSLDYLDKSQETQPLFGSDCPCYATPTKPFEINPDSEPSTTSDFQWKSSVNYFNTISTDQKLSTIAAQNTFWSPSNMMQPTPPPAGSSTVPHTPIPTPSYAIPSISGPHLPAADGASPPEAAVEATPETTPMKDIVKPVRPFPVNSNTVRAMFNTSQPSSPIKKDAGFSYEKSVITTQKLLRMVNDRNHSIIQISTNSTATTGTSTSNSVPSSPLPIDQPSFEVNRVTQLVSNLKLTPGGTAPRYDSPLIINQGDCTQEDQEVNDINSHLLQEPMVQQPQPQSQQSNQLLQSQSLPVQHPMREAYDAEDFEDQEEGSPCSAGGLHFKNSQSMINFTRQRYRMHSQCVVDSDPSYSTGTSPADTSGGYMMLKNSATASSTIRSDAPKKHQRRHSLPDLKKYMLKVDPKTMAVERQDLTLVETNGDSSMGSSPSEEEAISAATHFNKKQEQKTEEHTRRNMVLFQEIRKNLTKVGSIPQRASQNGSMPQQLISSGTQTIESYPQPYEQIVYGILQEDLKYKSDIAMKRLQDKKETDKSLDPHTMLDQYIELCVKKRAESGDPRRVEDMYRDHLTLLNLQLQYEKHRREIHAERNRRLLGKSRVIRGLEQNNEMLKDQVSRLTKEISSLNIELTGLRKRINVDWTKSSSDVIDLKERYAAELRKTQEQQARIKELEVALADDSRARKEQSIVIEQARGELFDLRNEMHQALHKAELGQQYRDELTKLQCEMILMGEIQLKCKERLEELDNIKARDIEIMMIQEAYYEEVKDLRSSVELKSAQLDSAKERLSELELQLNKRDETITMQKRMLKTVKEEHKEQFNALERKYDAQKAIVIRMEEAILELQINNAGRSPDSDKTDAVGSLDHTSPLSISLASSEGLSEIRNLALVVQSGGVNNNHEMDSNLPTPTTAGPSTISGGVRMVMDNNNSGPSGSSSGRPPLPSSHQHPHHHHPLHDSDMPGPSQRL